MCLPPGYREKGVGNQLYSEWKMGHLEEKEAQDKLKPEKAGPELEELCSETQGKGLPTA